jgi:hypothetical protein
LPPNFNTPSKGIKVLGVPLGIITFTPSFIKKALQQDVRHVDLLFRMGDVQVGFGILIFCFMQCPSYLLRYTPPSSTIIESFISFDSPLHKMFGHLFGPRSFNSPKGTLVHKQASFLITFGGIGLILTSTIAPATYLRNWAFVTLILVTLWLINVLSFLKP